ncbi:MAG: hypothetical protein VXZ82_13840 [Planctomycetota bacterium]|nr:hypothetical protein [Planctomycetota bacterium]
MKQYLCRSFWLPLILLTCPIDSALADSAELYGLTQSTRSRVCAGGMTLVRVGVSNHGEEPWTGKVTLKWKRRVGRESAREVKLRPRQRVLFEVPMEIPQNFKRIKRFDLEVTLFDEGGNIAAYEGAPQQRRIGFMMDSQLPPLSMGTAIEAPPPKYPFWYWPLPPSTEQNTFEAIMAARIDAGNSRRAVGLEHEGLPIEQQEWQLFDLVAVSDPNLLLDHASRLSAKQYLERGGRIWVQMDKLNCDSIQPLLTADQCLMQVGVIQLHDFVVEVSDGVSDFAERERTVHVDSVIEMKRLVQAGGTVTHSIDGWPAAVTFNIGYGQLVVTALDSSGWISVRSRSASRDPLMDSKYTMYPWAKQLAGTIAGVARNPTPLTDQVNYPVQRLGTAVVPRLWVLFALGSYCLVLIAVGFVQYSGGRLASMGVIVPISAVIVAAMMLMGRNSINPDQSEIVSRLQLVEYASDGSSAQITEQAALKLNSVHDIRLQGTGLGNTEPDIADESESPPGVFQQSQSDFGNWTLGNYAWPAGVSRVRSDYRIYCKNQIVSAELTSSGVELNLPDGQAKLQDAILWFTRGNPMLVSSVAEQLFSSGEIKVGKQRWILSNLMTEEQNRRLEMYQILFGDESSKTRPTRRLYGWSELIETVRAPKSLKQVGASLQSMPVVLQRPEAGVEFELPYGLIELRQSGNQPGASTAYDDRSGTWQDELTQGMDREFEFVMPAEVLPLEAKSILLEFDVRAPQRKVEIWVLTQYSEVPILSADSPSLPWETTLTQPEILESVRDGVLEVRVHVSGKPKNASRVINWYVGHFHATIRGAVQP